MVPLTSVLLNFTIQVASMMYQPREAELYTAETDSWKQLYIKSVNAWIAALLTMPGSEESEIRTPTLPSEPDASGGRL